jgi:gliding motility-associated-like protein
MTRDLRLFISAFTFLFACLFGLHNAAAQQDCFDAINVCSSSYTQTSSYSGTGIENEVPPGSSCLGAGETNSVWYTFTATTSGELLFQLVPIAPGDDYDFALYNLSTDSCSGIAAGTSSPISCNYSADAGPTGISTGGSGDNNGSGGSNQNAPVQVQQGETFALLISNFTSSQSGYELTFSGSASIIDNEPATLDSVGMNALCNPNSILVWFDQEIACSSISSGVFDIQITGPEPVVVTSVSGIGCNDGLTDWLSVGFANSIQTVGTYFVEIQTGADGNSFLDPCGNETVLGSSISFTVDFIGPELSLVTYSDASCGNNNGSAQVSASGGVAPYTYWWTTSPTQNGATATGLSPGTYRAWVTDANGCNKWMDVPISNYTPLDLSNIITTPVTCSGANDGTAQITPTGGVTPYIIEWQSNPVQTGASASNLSGGSLTVVVTDNTGCTASTNVSIPQPSAINLPTSIVNPDCGLANGSSTVTPSGGNGGFSFEWNTNPIQAGSTANNLTAGVYTVIVTDQNGCTNSTNVILTDNFAPNASIESTVPDCGQSNGQATAVATAGAAPYTYNWGTTPVQTGATATNLPEGDYFVTITDANGCIQIINVKIDTVEAPTIAGNLVQPTCGMADGEIDAVVTNGFEPFLFSWSSSANTTSNETGLAEGTYTVTLTDSTGCTATETFDLVQLPPETETTVTSVCEGEQNDFSFTTTSGATSWEWDFGDGNTSTDQNPTHTYAVAGAYDITLTLDGGCMPVTAQDTAQVFQPPVADFTIDPEIPTTQTTVSFLYSGSGATDFLWDFGNGNSDTSVRPEHLYDIDGEYTVTLTVTDENGCEDTTSQVIEVLLQPVIYLPNAFMPEGSTPNSRFKGYGIGTVSAELSIFDRWGTLVYYSSDVGEILNSGWDGTYKGKPLGLGAFAYKVKAQFYNNTSFEKLGTVTLIR